MLRGTLGPLPVRQNMERVIMDLRKEEVTHSLPNLNHKMADCLTTHLTSPDSSIRVYISSICSTVGTAIPVCLVWASGKMGSIRRCVIWREEGCVISRNERGQCCARGAEMGYFNRNVLCAWYVIFNCKHCSSGFTVLNCHWYDKFYENNKKSSQPSILCRLPYICVQVGVA